MKIEHVGQREPRKGSLRDLLYVVFGHKYKMVIFMVLLFGVVVARTFLQTGTYRSESRLLLRIGREMVALDPTVTIGEIAHINRTYDWEINSELEILRSREIAERVVDEMGPRAFLEATRRSSEGDDTVAVAAEWTNRILDTLSETISRVKAAPKKLAQQLGLSAPLSERDQAIRTLVENIRISAVPNTSVISLGYDAPSPEFAREVLETFMQAFLDKHLAVFSTGHAQQFFEQQVSDTQIKLRQAELQMQAMKDTTGISSLEEQRLAAVTKIGTLELGIATTEGELASADARAAELQRMLADIPETLLTEEVTGFSDYGTDLMRSRLYDLRLQEKDLEVKFPVGSRQLEMVREQVREGQAMLEKEQSRPNRTETRTGVNSTHQQMQVELLREQSNVSALRSKLESLHAQLAEARGFLRQLNEAEHWTARLQREIGLLAESYERYFTKLEEARIDQALKGERMSNISVVQDPTLPIEPVGPGKIVRLGLGLVLAAVGGVGFAFFCDYLDHSIKTPEDVQDKLQLPTLASIPRTRRNTVQPASGVSYPARLTGKTRSITPARWGIPEHVRRHYITFRERLLLAADGASHVHYVIGVTSCSRYEGVSTVAANLACSLSEMGSGSVLLMDANSHDPSIHRIFQTQLSPGLLDVVAAGYKGSGDNEIVRRAAKLNVLTAGGADGSPARTLTVDHLVRFLHTTRQEYRFIVLDMPALDEDGSVVRLAGLCDGVVLVVETERLRWQAVARARQQLQQWNINILGALLNKRRFPVPNWVYAAL